MSSLPWAGVENEQVCYTTKQTHGLSSVIAMSMSNQYELFE